MKGKELQKAVHNSGILIAELEAKSGIKERTIYSLYDKDEVPQHYLDKLEKAGVKLQITTENTKLIPYYDIDAIAGNVKIFNEEKSEYVTQRLSIPAFSDCDMFISISGNSMYPKYCSGEMVALKKITDREVVAFGEAYIIVTKEQRLLKFVKKGKDKDHWLLVSENKDFEPFEIKTSKILHLYIVKGKITKNII